MRHKIGVYSFGIAVMVVTVVSAQSLLFAGGLINIGSTSGLGNNGSCSIQDRNYEFVRNCRDAFIPATGGLICKSTQNGDKDAVLRINNFGGSSGTGAVTRNAVVCVVANGGHNIHDCAPKTCSVTSGDGFITGGGGVGGGGLLS